MRADAAVGAPGPPPRPGPGLSLGVAAADENAAQGVRLAAHGDRRADVQVAEGVKAGGAREWDFPGYISEVRTLGEDQQDTPAPRQEGGVRTRRGSSWGREYGGGGRSWRAPTSGKTPPIHFSQITPYPKHSAIKV